MRRPIPWLDRIQRLLGSRLLAESVGPLLITLLVWLFYRRLLWGEFPVSHDHPAHMFNAWLTSDVLLPSGRLFGWSDLWFAGYPVNEQYGPGGNLWVALFRLLTFGALDYGATYGLAMFGLLLLVPLSAYAMGRAFVGRAAGAIAGLCLVLTKGGWYDLGWFWVLEMGVWPFALGAALTMLSLVALRGYLSVGGHRRLVWSSLAVAAAILGHPMSLLLLGIAGPLVVLHVWLEQGRAGATRVLLRGVAAGGLGIALTAFWLVPFVAKSAYTQKLGEIWMELSAMVPSLVQLSMFGNEWRLVFGLAVVGVLIAIRRRHVWALFCATTGGFMALFASASTQYSLRLFDVLSPLASIQYPRFLGFVRVFVYLLAGYAIVELFRAVRAVEASRTWTKRGRDALLVGLPLLLWVPLAPAALEYVDQNHTVAPESFRTQVDHRLWPRYLEAGAWVAEQLEGQPPSRVGAFGHPYDHVLSALPVYTGLRVFTGGFVPAHTYRFFFDGHRDASTLRAVGVRYVIAAKGWDERRPDVAERKRFGPVHVYELLGGRPSAVSAVGDCAVEVDEQSADRLVATVTDVTAPCRLRIHRGDFPNWQATLDGAPLEVRRIGLYPGSHYKAFMSVEVDRAGTLELSWRVVDSDRIGAIVSGVALLVGLLLLVLGGRLRAPSFATRLVRPARIAVWTAVAVAAVVAVAAAATRAREGPYTFDRHLSEANKEVYVRGEWRACPPADKGHGWVCGDDWDRVRAGLFSFVYDSRYCIFAHPSPRGPKRIVFEDVPLTRRLSGFVGLLDTSQSSDSVAMTVQIGDELPVTLTPAGVGEVVGFELDTTPGPRDVTVTVTADPPQWRHVCFNMQVIP